MTIFILALKIVKYNISLHTLGLNFSFDHQLMDLRGSTLTFKKKNVETKIRGLEGVLVLWVCEDPLWLRYHLQLLSSCIINMLKLYHYHAICISVKHTALCMN